MRMRILPFLPNFFSHPRHALPVCLLDLSSRKSKGISEIKRMLLLIKETAATQADELRSVRFFLGANNVKADAIERFYYEIFCGICRNGENR